VAEANLAHAVAEKERADNLLKTGGITDKDHLTAQVGLRIAEAARAQARAEVAIAAQQHARCQIKAPFAGRVARRFPDPGTLLAAGAPVFTLVDDKILEFRGSVPSADFGRVRLGAAVEVGIDALRTSTSAVASPASRRWLTNGRAPSRSWRGPGSQGARRRPLRTGTRQSGNGGRRGGRGATALLRDGAQPDRAEVFVVARARPSAGQCSSAWRWPTPCK